MSCTWDACRNTIRSSCSFCYPFKTEMGKQIWVKLPIIKFSIYCMYSKILLFQLTQDWTGAELPYVPNYQTVTVLTKFLQVLFCYCSYILAVQLLRGVFHLDISFSCWFRILFCFLVSSKLRTLMEGKGSEDTTMVDVQTLLKAFLNMLPRSVCFIDETFFW